MFYQIMKVIKNNSFSMSAIYDAAIIWDNIVLCAYTRPFYKKLKWGEIGEYLQNEKFSTPKKMLKPSVTL